MGSTIGSVPTSGGGLDSDMQIESGLGSDVQIDINVTSDIGSDEDYADSAEDNTSELPVDQAIDPVVTADSTISGIEGFLANENNSSDLQSSVAVEITESLNPKGGDGENLNAISTPVDASDELIENINAFVTATDDSGLPINVFVDPNDQSGGQTGEQEWERYARLSSAGSISGYDGAGLNYSSESIGNLDPYSGRTGNLENITGSDSDVGSAIIMVGEGPTDVVADDTPFALANGDLAGDNSGREYFSDGSSTQTVVTEDGGSITFVFDSNGDITSASQQEPRASEVVEPLQDSTTVAVSDPVNGNSSVGNKETSADSNANLPLLDYNPNYNLTGEDLILDPTKDSNPDATNPNDPYGLPNGSVTDAIEYIEAPKLPSDSTSTDFGKLPDEMNGTPQGDSGLDDGKIINGHQTWDLANFHSLVGEALFGPPKGALTLDAHGSENRLWIFPNGDDVELGLDHKQVANLLESDPTYTTEKPIILKACNVGDENGLAQKLSGELPNIIVAPAGEVAYTSILNTISSRGSSVITDAVFNVYQGGVKIGETNVSFGNPVVVVDSATKP